MKGKLSYKYYHLAKENSENIIKLKHDMKNQLQVAYIIFKQDPKEAIKILDKIDENLEQINPIYYCENTILNTILALKIHEAKKEQIKVNIKIDKNILLQLEDLDICNLFGNLLDNSIEACKKSFIKNINLSIFQKKIILL